MKMANKDTKLSGARDKEGFILLKPTADFKFNNKKPKTVKKSSNPYKKGTKKYRMYKSCKNHRVSKWISDFHHEKAENVVLGVDKKDRPKVVITSHPVGKKELSDAGIQKTSGLSIMINTGYGTYQKIPFEAYKKLKKIDKILIEFGITCYDDSDADDEEEVFSHQYHIDSIGELFHWYLYLRHLNDYVNELTCSLLWYSRVEYKVNMIVLKKDGTNEYYKGNFNDFLEHYKITDLI